MAVMSFHPVKHITTGEGGVVLTNDDFLNKKLKRLRSHGITSTPEDFINKDLAFPSHDSRSTIHDSPNPWYYEQVDLGYNYRITNIQCALGISQLKRLDEFRRRRREIVNKYNEAFRGIKVIEAPYESKDCDSNFHLYVLLLDFEQIGMERAQFMMALRKQKILTQVHYIPVHLQPYYQKIFKTKWGDYPQAEKYYQKCLSIPLFPALLDEEVDNVIDKIKALVSK
jgi:dTDP-4-amino-4,6-dideoxygalactose transaminase